jgi:hypothetical protein
MGDEDGMIDEFEQVSFQNATASVGRTTDHRHR